MYLPASKDLHEPAHMRSLIDASAFPSFRIVRRSSMGCVLLYLPMFWVLNQTNMCELKKYLHVLIKSLLINKYG